MTAPAPAQDLPALPGPDSLLLTRFIALNLDLPALAHGSGRPLTDLLPWAVSEPIQTYLSAFEHFRRRSVQAKTFAYYETATDALVKALDSASDPVEIRRIAEAILRAAARLLPPAPRSKPAKARPDPAPTEPSPPPATPEPAASPAAAPGQPKPRLRPAPSATSALTPPTPRTQDSGSRTQDAGSQAPVLTTATPRTKLLPTHTTIPGLDYPVVPPLGLPSDPPLLAGSPARRTPTSLAAAAGAPGPAP